MTHTRTTFSTSRGSVATCFRCGGIFHERFIAILLLAVQLKEHRKSVNVWAKLSCLVFLDHPVSSRVLTHHPGDKLERVCKWLWPIRRHGYFMTPAFRFFCVCHNTAITYVRHLTIFCCNASQLLQTWKHFYSFCRRVMCLLIDRALALLKRCRLLKTPIFPLCRKYWQNECLWVNGW